MISEERLRELWREYSARTLPSQTQDFARAVEREAYEAAAKVCVSQYITPSANLTDGVNGYNCAIEMCAAAIRALIPAASPADRPPR